MSDRVVLAAALSECVHIAGVMDFLFLAESARWKTLFRDRLSLCFRSTSMHASTGRARGVSYRLTPDTGQRLLGDLAQSVDDLRALDVRFAMG
jgi:hypothetical protein